jgi:hypothetical protein
MYIFQEGVAGNCHAFLFSIGAFVSVILHEVYFRLTLATVIKNYVRFSTVYAR